MKKKNVLLLGTSFSAIPIARRIKRHGFNLISVGSQREEGVHQFSDQVLHVDYSDFATLEKQTRDLDLFAIVPSCNDIAYANACKLAHGRGIFFPDTPERVSLLHEKDSFKKFLKEIDVDTPSSDPHVIDKSDCIIVKPVDSFSGRGCTVVPKRVQLPAAIEHAKAFSALNAVVVEEFVQGSLHSLSSFIDDGEIYANFFADEHCIHNQFAVSASNVPSLLESHQKAKLVEINEKIVQGSGILRGLLHTQFIISDDRIVVLEVMRRAPGDLLGQQHFLSTANDYWELYFTGFLPENLNSPKKQEAEIKFIVREIVATSNKQYFECLDLELSTPNILNVSFVPLIPSGNYVEKHPTQKIGILFYEVDNYSFRNRAPLDNANRKFIFKE